VRVEVEHDERTVSVIIRDEGPGIPPEQIPQLFTRFFRGDPARPRAEGSGLGLSIAKAGADAHGGNLKLVGGTQGAAFRLTLPATGARHS
jgi:two-component system sensor histidine kinase MtrB